MTEAEIKIVEQALDTIKDIETELHQMRTEVEYRISQLANLRDSLVRLLPNENRINRLFN